jgi:succinate-acetate transporter protein
LLELLSGKIYTAVVYAFFGAFWLSIAATLQPANNAFGAYSPDLSLPTLGLDSVGFQSSQSFFFLAIAIACFILLLLSVKTNVVNVVILTSLTIMLALTSGTHWETCIGNAVTARRVEIVAGMWGLITCICLVWEFLAVMLPIMGFSFHLPRKYSPLRYNKALTDMLVVGDLSKISY